MPVLQKFLKATPTAELEPITADYVQSDEVLIPLQPADCLGGYGHDIQGTQRLWQTT